MTARICLVTTGQPASNPRLVKEADALIAAGYDVHVVAAYSADWATDADRNVVGTRRWSHTFVDWRLGSAPWMFWRSRIRHRAARLAAPWIPGTSAAEAAVARIAPELRRAAAAVRADLYVAHNLGALPAAWRAARVHAARLGFDAEDDHAGQLQPGDRMRSVVERVERRYIRECDYVTASSPGIADIYRPLSKHGGPECVLNVFPKTQRPARPVANAGTGPITLYWFSQVIGPDRGLEDVVRALGRVPAGAAILHLRGFWWPGYETRLRELAASCGLLPEHIVGHALSAPDEMVRRSAPYDVGLSVEPGRTRNSDLALGNKVFTYLLGGQAVLTTRTSAHRWLLEQIPGAALSYEAGDVETLAGHLSRWIAHRDDLARARQAAWTLGDRRFNWDAEQHIFLRVIASVLGAGSASAETSRAIVTRRGQGDLAGAS